MKLSSIKAAGAAALSGAWVDIPSLPGLRLKVRAMNNPKSRAILSDFYANVPRGKRGADESDAVERRQILDAILIDWEGLTDDAGEAIPYSREKAEEILNDSDVRFTLTEAITYAATFVGEIASKDAEDLIKN